jgi:hypothetical protein
MLVVQAKQVKGKGVHAEAHGPTVTSTLCTLVLSPTSDLRPGFSTFTFLCPASCLGQRPLCDSATPRGKVSVNVRRITKAARLVRHQRLIAFRETAVGGVRWMHRWKPVSEAQRE